MKFDDEVDWPSIFAEHIDRPSLADPHNRHRSAYVATMLFLEAALRETHDQLSGLSKDGTDDLGWARISRRLVVRRARRLAAEKLAESDRQGLQLGEGGFRDRWPGWGGRSNFLACVVRYFCASPRWRSFFDFGARKARAELPEIGAVDLPDLIQKIAIHDLHHRVRLSQWWLFQLSLTLNTKWRAVATKAYRELLEEYGRRWIPVYEEGLRRFRVSLRPDLSPAKLCAMISAQITGFATQIAGLGNEPRVLGEDAFALFAKSVQLLILAAIDTGDGRDVAAALSDRLTDSP